MVVMGIHSYAQDNVPKVISGSIDRIESFKSDYVTSRNIDVWLPVDYSNNKKYSVLYMHDGQMLYDATVTWNKQSWDIDDAASDLFKSSNISEFIVVGIWNGGSTRHVDYFPQKPFTSLNKVQKDSVTQQLMRSHVALVDSFNPQSDDYLKFIVQELKPFIDNKYSVHTGKNDTYIMGSSMGGLISMYAVCEYPQVFGGAACLSTHWPGTFTLDHNPIPDAFISYLRDNLPDSSSHKIYFDCGDSTLDALYPAIQKNVDQVMIDKGYNQTSWLSKYYTDAPHTENAWAARVATPLKFLFEK